MISDIVVATGTFQSEMGCPTDNAVDCMRGWLQDPDGDGVYSLCTTEVPAGHLRRPGGGRRQRWWGPASPSRWHAGDATRFTYRPGQRGR